MADLEEPWLPKAGEQQKRSVEITVPVTKEHVTFSISCLFFLAISHVWMAYLAGKSVDTATHIALFSMALLLLVNIVSSCCFFWQKFEPSKSFVDILDGRKCWAWMYKADYVWLIFSVVYVGSTGCMLHIKRFMLGKQLYVASGFVASFTFIPAMWVMGYPLWAFMVGCSTASRRRIRDWIKESEDWMEECEQKLRGGEALDWTDITLLMAKYRTMRQDIRSQWKPVSMSLPWLSLMMGSFALLFAVCILWTYPSDPARKVYLAYFFILASLSFVLPVQTLADITVELGKHKKKLQRMPLEKFDAETLRGYFLLLQLLHDEPVQVVLIQWCPQFKLIADTRFARWATIEFFVKLPALVTLVTHFFIK